MELPNPRISNFPQWRVSGQISAISHQQNQLWRSASKERLSRRGTAIEELKADG
jgi:hypothetical protein